MVYAFVQRTDAVETRDDWDTVGMRGTQSRTTVPNGAVAPADRVVRRVVLRPEPRSDRLGIFSVFEVLLASASCSGVARRARSTWPSRRRRRGRRRRPGARTATTPTSAGASRKWRSPTTACSPRSRRSRTTWTSSSITAAVVVPPAVGSEAPRGRGRQADRRRGDARRRRSPPATSSAASTATCWPACSTPPTPSPRTRPSPPRGSAPVSS